MKTARWVNFGLPQGDELMFHSGLCCQHLVRIFESCLRKWSLDVYLTCNWTIAQQTLIKSGAKISHCSGCGSVGRAVASDTRGLQFESSQKCKYWTFVYCQMCIEKTKIKKKRLVIDLFKNLREVPWRMRNPFEQQLYSFST